MRTKDKFLKATTGRSGSAGRQSFFRSVQDAAVRAVVTATVTFGVGLLLKKMFENSVADAAKEGAKAGAEEQANPDQQQSEN